MKKILSILLACVLLCCTIPTVFAAEETPVTSGDELQALIDAASSGDELHVKVGSTTSYNDAFEIASTIKIDKPLKIYLSFVDHWDSGWYNLCFECKTGYIFYITGDNVELHFGDKIELSGQQIDNMYDEAIYVEGQNCVIDGGLFADCGERMDWFNGGIGGATYDGGAIYVDGQNCTIKNARFERCTGYDGGAICVNQHNCHVINCSFDICEAVDYGGAIYVCTGTKGFVASHCTFEAVMAKDYAHYISGARDAKVFDCSPNWGDEGCYSKWVTFEEADPLGDYRRNNPSSRLYPANIGEGYYVIRSAVDTNYCLEIAGGSNAKNDRDNLRLWPADTSTSKIFEIKKDGDAYKIIAVHSGKSLDVENSSTEDGANIFQFEHHGRNNQRWIFEDDPVDGYYIHAVEGGWMDAAGCVGGAKPLADGSTNVQSWSYTGAKNQMWILEKVDYTPSGFILSEGNTWIIAGIGVVAVIAIAVVVSKKKKKPALAEGETVEVAAEPAEKTEE